MVNSAVVVDCLLVLTGIECVLELSVNASLLGKVVVEKSLAAVQCIPTTLTLVISALHSELGISDLSSSECCLIIAVNSLLGCQAVVLRLFRHDFPTELIKHAKDVGDWSLSLHSRFDLHHEGWLVKRAVMGLGGYCIGDR